MKSGPLLDELIDSAGDSSSRTAAFVGSCAPCLRAERSSPRRSIRLGGSELGGADDSRELRFSLRSAERSADALDARPTLPGGGSARPYAAAPGFVGLLAMWW
jgi:hypothetical protein